MKLIIAADIHGFYSKWRKIKRLLNHNDHLAIAGDLFDTRYGSFSDSDYLPDKIRQDIRKMTHSVYYVYGNCDQSSYINGYDMVCRFRFAGYNIMMTHGHMSVPVQDNTDILIQGHTHERKLMKTGGIIHVNPGSIAKPRDGIPSYGIITNQYISLLNHHDEIITEMMINSSQEKYMNIFGNPSEY